MASKFAKISCLFFSVCLFFSLGVAAQGLENTYQTEPSMIASLCSNDFLKSAEVYEIDGNFAFGDI